MCPSSSYDTAMLFATRVVLFILLLTIVINYFRKPKKPSPVDYEALHAQNIARPSLSPLIASDEVSIGILYNNSPACGQLRNAVELAVIQVVASNCTSGSAFSGLLSINLFLSDFARAMDRNSKLAPNLTVSKLTAVMHKGVEDEDLGQPTQALMKLLATWIDQCVENNSIPSDYKYGFERLSNDLSFAAFKLKHS